MLSSNIDNTIKSIEKPIIYKIDDNNYIKTQLLEKRGTKFYDVVFYNNGKEIFIGRFFNDLDNLKVAYNKGNILIYCDKYNEKEHKYNIVEVISLYNIIDDTFYSVTEEEALSIFDDKLISVFLKNKDKRINRNDLEKRKRLIK